MACINGQGLLNAFMSLKKLLNVVFLSVKEYSEMCIIKKIPYYVEFY